MTSLHQAQPLLVENWVWPPPSSNPCSRQPIYNIATNLLLKVQCVREDLCELTNPPATGYALTRDSWIWSISKLEGWHMELDEDCDLCRHETHSQYSHHFSRWCHFSWAIHSGMLWVLCSVIHAQGPCLFNTLWMHFHVVQLCYIFEISYMRIPISDISSIKSFRLIPEIRIVYTVIISLPCCWNDSCQMDWLYCTISAFS